MLFLIGFVINSILLPPHAIGSAGRTYEADCVSYEESDSPTDLAAGTFHIQHWSVTLDANGKTSVVKVVSDQGVRTTKYIDGKTVMTLVKPDGTVIQENPSDVPRSFKDAVSKTKVDKKKVGEEKLAGELCEVSKVEFRVGNDQVVSFSWIPKNADLRECFLWLQVCDYDKNGDRTSLSGGKRFLNIRRVEP